MAEWFWIDRWVGSSAFQLPQEARGVYREMLTQAWRRGAQLPNDHEAIRRVTGTTLKEWRRAWPQIAHYWRVDGDTLVNDTQLLVYADAQARHEKASSRGRKGAQASAQARAQALTQAPAQAPPKPVLKDQPLSLSPSLNVVPSELLRPGRGQAPMSLGLTRLKFWRWMAEDFIGKLGTHAEAFDIETWVIAQDRLETRVITGDWWAYWLPAFEAEVRRRGLPLAGAIETPDQQAAAVVDILKKRAALQ